MVVIAEDWFIIRRQSVMPWLVMIVATQLLPFNIYENDYLSN